MDYSVRPATVELDEAVELPNHIQVLVLLVIIINYDVARPLSSVSHTEILLPVGTTLYSISSYVGYNYYLWYSCDKWSISHHNLLHSYTIHTDVTLLLS